MDTLIDELEVRAIAATGGKWVNGDIIRSAFTDPASQECPYCVLGEALYNEREFGVKKEHLHLAKPHEQSIGKEIVSITDDWYENIVLMATEGNGDFGGVVVNSDAEYIAIASPSNILALIEEVRRLKRGGQS